MVVRHRLARRPARLPDHLLPRAARRRRAPTRAASIRARSCSRTPRSSDPKRGRLLHDQRAARAGFSLAHAETERTGVWIDDWSLELEGNRYHARIAAREFDFDFTLFSRKQLVLQGEAGLQPQGPPAGGGELLLQPPAAQRRRQAERQHGRRHRVARPRMVERLSRARGGRLGLVPASICSTAPR